MAGKAMIMSAAGFQALQDAAKANLADLEDPEWIDCSAMPSAV
ncbi:hypothetical protein R0137_00345 [Congregibacter brevis]|uniref:Uncharacterized protein n=1 Tax=Congregibacter brevis TaxID=3081201 RepID=A0ABZ0IDB9_9GAMM|nr:hypothetical protein R0137_00345 [Congregibacter sp. IMCC45268]